MSFDNSVYPNRKDKFRVYPNDESKRVSRKCRNHGDCDYCKNKRTINDTRTKLKAKYDLEEE